MPRKESGSPVVWPVPSLNGGKPYILDSNTFKGLRTRGGPYPVGDEASHLWIGTEGHFVHPDSRSCGQSIPRVTPPRLPVSSAGKDPWIIHKLYRYRHKNYKYDQLSWIMEISWTVHRNCSGGREEFFVDRDKIFWVIHFILKFCNSVTEGKGNILAVAW